MLKQLGGWFRPAPPVAGLSPAEIGRLYPRYRLRVFEAAFLAYAALYIVRNNFAPVSKEIGAALHYDKAMIGDILAGTAIAYGLGKFVMGYFADRSDARKYIATGMLLTAILNFLFGTAANCSPVSVDPERIHPRGNCSSNTFFQTGCSGFCPLRTYSFTSPAIRWSIGGQHT